MDAHDSVAYVVDDGVTAVDVSDESAPRVIASLTDFDLSGCASVAAYAAANGQKRLAVACAGSNALVVVDANAPREGLRVLGAVQDDTALSGISSVVVKGTLAFVTAPGVQRVVSVDLAADASPHRDLSFEKLSVRGCRVLRGGQPHRRWLRLRARRRARHDHVLVPSG